MSEVLIGMGDRQTTVTPDVIEEQRRRHVVLYERRLASGSPAVVVSETTALLELWRGMAGKSWLTLNEAEEGELVDALTDDGWEFACNDDDMVVLAGRPGFGAGGGE